MVQQSHCYICKSKGFQNRWTNKTYTHSLLVMLFLTARRRKSPRCPPTDDRMDETRSAPRSQGVTACRAEVPIWGQETVLSYTTVMVANTSHATLFRKCNDQHLCCACLKILFHNKYFGSRGHSTIVTLKNDKDKSTVFYSRPKPIFDT